MGTDLKKVLICDDSMLARKQIKDILKNIEGYEIFEAEDGMVAVEQYKAQTPDVVFMDIVMPQKDGIEAVKDIISFNSEAKIVMVSSVGNKKNLKEVLLWVLNMN